jgi:Flp pilus assembly pilin Flp
VEYALIIAFIAVVIAGVVATLGSQVAAAISSVIPGL